MRLIHDLGSDVQCGSWLHCRHRQRGGLYGNGLSLQLQLQRNLLFCPARLHLVRDRWMHRNVLHLQLPLHLHLLRGPAGLHLDCHDPLFVLRDRLYLPLPYQFHHLRESTGLHLDRPNHLHLRGDRLFLQLPL